MKTKILHINDSFQDNSGSGIVAKATLDLFNNEDFESDYFTVKGYEYKDSKFEKYFPSSICSIKDYLFNLFNYYYNIKSQQNIMKVLKEYNPEIVHVHSLRSPSLTYSILKPIIIRKIPIVMTIHDCFIICPMMTLIKGNGGYCVDVKCKNFNKFHCVFNHCGKNIEQSFRLALLSFINKITRYDKYIAKFITPSNALRNLILKFDSDITPEKVITVNNFLYDGQFGEIQPCYENRGYFLYVGRLDKEKGLHYLLEAMKGLPRNIEVHIVGKGNEENNLKQYAKENNLDNIKFLGFKRKEELKEEYQNCISSILPCNWFEIFGLTNVESFINGKPVIASNIGAIPEIVEHNKTGLLFEPTNVQQLQSCIMNYWNNPAMVLEHGKNAYKKALTTYTSIHYYRELYKIYQGLGGKRTNEI